MRFIGVLVLLALWAPPAAAELRMQVDPNARPAPATRAVTKPKPAPTATELADLYVKVGRELSIQSKRDPYSTTNLWPRYRWVNFMESLKTPIKRAEAAAMLEKILADTKKLHP